MGVGRLVTIEGVEVKVGNELVLGISVGIELGKVVGITVSVGLSVGDNVVGNCVELPDG